MMMMIVGRLDALFQEVQLTQTSQIFLFGISRTNTLIWLAARNWPSWYGLIGLSAECVSPNVESTATLGEWPGIGELSHDEIIVWPLDKKGTSIHVASTTLIVKTNANVRCLDIVPRTFEIYGQEID